MEKNKRGGKEQFIALLYEHPELDVVPMVDAEVCGDDCGSWAGRIGGAFIDSVYMDEAKERWFFESADFDSLVEENLDSMIIDPAYCSTPTEILAEKANAAIRALPWEKVIVLYITTP